MKLKNLFFVLLALALVLSLGVCAAAESGDEPPTVVVSGTLELGDARYTFYSDGNLVLEGNGPVYGVYMDEPMEPYFYDIKTLTVGEGITSLNGLVFTRCKNLETVKLPKTFHITEDNFMECSHLKQFIVDADNPNHGVDAAGALYNKAMTVLYKYVTGSSATVYSVANETEVIWEDAFSNCAALEKVVLPDSVKTIQDAAFSHCLALREINLPNNLTSLGGNAFLNCRSLQQITLPDQLTRIRAYTFMQCVEMTSISIPASLREIGYGAFQSCEALTDVYIMMDENTWNNEVTVEGKNDYLLAATPHFLAPSILESGNCGADGSDVQYQLYSDGTLVITGSGEMQYWTHVTYTPWADLRDNILRVIIQPGVTNVGYYAFMYTKNLESVTLPEGIEYIGEWAFTGDEKLESVNFPSTIRNIYAHAFQGCKGLKTADMQNCKITTVDYCTFNQCSKLETVTVPPTLLGFSQSSFSDCFALREINIPDGVVTIGERAFGGCRSLENIALPDSVTTIKNGAFQGCSKVNPPKLPDNLETLEELAFAACNLDSVAIPAHLTSIPRRAFAGNPNLTSVEIPASVASINSSAFTECTALTAYTVAAENQSYKSVDGVLFTRDGTALLDYPAAKPGSAYAVPSGVTEIKDYAFWTCSQLTYLGLPEGLTTIGEYAFYSCTGLTSLQLPHGVTTLGGSAFRACTALAEIDLSDTLESIGVFAFECCNSLRSLTLPATLTSMGHYAFNACQNLEKVTFYPALTQIPEGAFYSCDALSEIHYVGTIDQWLALSVDQYGNDEFKNAAKHIHADADSLAVIDADNWKAIPTSDAGLQKGALHLDFTDAVQENYPAEQQSDALAMLTAGSWSLDYDSMALKGTLTLPEALYASGAGKEITWYPARDVLASALREAGVTWITLPYSADGLRDGDWYLDLDAFVDAVGRGKTEKEKAEVRELLLQHVTFSYNPGGSAFVYRFDYDKLPVEDGDPISGSVELPIGLLLGDEDAFPYDYNALKNCVQQYRAPDAPDEPDQPEENESWFQKHVVGPLKSAVATILSFFRKLFKKKK